MIDLKLYDRVKYLEMELDSMRLIVHTVRQEQKDMLEQIRRLKEVVANDDYK